MTACAEWRDNYGYQDVVEFRITAEEEFYQQEDTDESYEEYDHLADEDLDDYITRLSRLERRGRIGQDDVEWLAAARALKNDRDRKKEPEVVDDLNPIIAPNGWGETPESVQANKNSDNLIRNYGIGAQIIKDLKIRKMILITKSPKKVIGLDGYDIKITKQELI